MRSNIQSGYIIFLLLALLGCKEQITPDWEEIPISYSGEELEVVKFVNASTGFAAGGIRFEKSRILKTTDGGNNWEEQFPDREFEFTIFDLDFRDELHGLCASLGSSTLRTKNGGDTWRLKAWLYRDPLRSIHIVNDSVAIAVGGDGYDSGVIFRTEDFGLNWTMVDTFDFELRDVFFTDKQTGYACGYGVVLKTTDAGKTWDFTPARGEFFSAIHFPTPSVGYVAGRTGSIQKTTDAGETWEKLRHGNFPFNPRHYYNDIRFSDEKTGYVVGDNGVMLRTVDGGDTWQKLDHGVEVDLNGIDLFDDGSGIVVGGQGKIFRFRKN